MRTAWLARSPPFAEAVTTTASAPAPSVQARTASPASSGLSASSAPSSRASSRRFSEGLDSGDAAAGRPKRLDRDQPEQAQPDDDHAIAERRLGTTHSLERDGPDRRERRVAHRDSFGDGHDEVRRNGHDLGVVRAARARAGDTLADVEPGVATGVEDGARARVAEGVVLRDRAADCADRLPDAVLAGVLERLGDEVRVLDRPCGE